jgi:hypothetical protein
MKPIHICEVYLCSQLYTISFYLFIIFFTMNKKFTQEDIVYNMFHVPCKELDGVRVKHSHILSNWNIVNQMSLLH